jgi:nicotinamidase/pyrazinamidase
VHLVLVDLRNSELNGQEAEDLLHEVGITVNRNAVPFDPRPPMVTSGLRIGTPALASRGLDAAAFTEVADMIGTALAQGKNADTAALRSPGRQGRRGLPAVPGPRGLEAGLGRQNARTDRRRHPERFLPRGCPGDCPRGGGGGGGLRVSAVGTWMTYTAVVGRRTTTSTPPGTSPRRGTEPDFEETWPVHCVVGTPGAELAPGARHLADRRLVPQGRVHRRLLRFRGASGGRWETLADWLREPGVMTDVDVCGIATDFCVRATALDAVAEEFGVRALTDLCAEVTPGPGAVAFNQMAYVGVDW